MSSKRLRKAAIDVGSNTTRLLVADVEATRIKAELAREMKITGLARGFDGKNLAHESLARTKSALVEFYNLARKLDAELIAIGFTGVARRAVNIEPLLNELNSLECVKALILSAQLEAELSANGVQVKTGKKEFLLVDVGGGSTEVVLKSGENFEFFSFVVGTVDLQQRYFVQGAVDAHIVGCMMDEIYERMADAKKWSGSPLPLFANAATATVCAAVVQDIDQRDSHKIEGFEVKSSELERVLSELAAMTEDERIERYPILRGRENVFICGLVALRCALKTLRRKSFFVTEGSLLEGLLFFDVS